MTCHFCREYCSRENLGHRFCKNCNLSRAACYFCSYNYTPEYTNKLIPICQKTTTNTYISDSGNGRILITSLSVGSIIPNMPRVDDTNQYVYHKRYPILPPTFDFYDHMQMGGRIQRN
jgi:hypothetical protein